mmetsp:Transcript_2261/g.6470  ORF Transcript_2261/g.6470 Transcript_2261/m.6470 type:complete len:180 (-) Transcript_2261:330-869(-)
MVATRRRVTRGKSDKYEIGDRVEVVRVDGMEVGILLSKDDADDRSGDVTHWVVSVNGSSEEEVVSERMLGRVLEDIDQSDSSTFDKTQKEAPVKKATKAKVKSGPKNKKGGNRRVNTRAGANKNGEEPNFDEGEEIVRRPTPRPKKKDGDETVIEVKMLTGTLFIYRGENHRVEFVRTV